MRQTFELRNACLGLGALLNQFGRGCGTENFTQCAAEDDRVGTGMLEEQITAFDGYVLSVDVAAEV